MSARPAFPDLLLRYTLCLVLGLGAVQALMSMHPPVPRILVLVIAGAELAGCVLLALPKLTGTGGWILLATLLAAMAVHLLHGLYGIENLVVDAAAVYSVTAKYQRAS